MSEANLSFLITDIRVDSQNIFHQTRDFIGAKKHTRRVSISRTLNFTNSVNHHFISKWSIIVSTLMH